MLLFFDPKHGGCLRVVEPMGDQRYRIRGAYGDDEAPQRPNGYWYAKATVLRRSGEDEEWEVDFHPGKPLKRPRFLKAQFRPLQRRIEWEDGNTWKQLYFHPRQFPRNKSSKRRSSSLLR